MKSLDLDWDHVSSFNVIVTIRSGLGNHSVESTHFFSEKDVLPLRIKCLNSRCEDGGFDPKELIQGALVANNGKIDINQSIDCGGIIQILSKESKSCGCKCIVVGRIVTKG